MEKLKSTSEIDLLEITENKEALNTDMSLCPPNSLVTVRAILVDEDGNTLLIENGSQSKSREDGSFEFPGGKVFDTAQGYIDYGKKKQSTACEKSKKILEALVCELREETSLGVNHLQGGEFSYLGCSDKNLTSPYKFEDNDSISLNNKRTFFFVMKAPGLLKDQLEISKLTKPNGEREDDHKNFESYGIEDILSDTDNSELIAQNSYLSPDLLEKLAITSEKVKGARLTQQLSSFVRSSVFEVVNNFTDVPITSIPSEIIDKKLEGLTDDNFKDAVESALNFIEDEEFFGIDLGSLKLRVRALESKEELECFFKDISDFNDVEKKNIGYFFRVLRAYGYLVSEMKIDPAKIESESIAMEESYIETANLKKCPLKPDNELNSFALLSKYTRYEYQDSNKRNHYVWLRRREKSLNRIIAKYLRKREAKSEMKKAMRDFSGLRGITEDDANEAYLAYMKTHRMVEVPVPWYNLVSQKEEGPKNASGSETRDQVQKKLFGKTPKGIPVEHQIITMSGAIKEELGLRDHRFYSYKQSKDFASREGHFEALTYAKISEDIKNISKQIGEREARVRNNFEKQFFHSKSTALYFAYDEIFAQMDKIFAGKDETLFNIFADFISSLSASPELARYSQDKVFWYRFFYEPTIFRSKYIDGKRGKTKLQEGLLACEKKIRGFSVSSSVKGQISPNMKFYMEDYSDSMKRKKAKKKK